MKFSIIIPSYNQETFIGETFENIRRLRNRAAEVGHEVEVLLYDNNSNDQVQGIIAANMELFDVVAIQSDKGQYDAINKGIARLSGEYWTWLNTDDKIDEQGFMKLAEMLGKDPGIDYIYGDIEVIDENSQRIKIVRAHDLSIDKLINDDAGIYQPGSFFRKKFTDTIGSLVEYRCCFDYEYILRLLHHSARISRCDFVVAQFRYHSSSKSGSIVPVFIREQLDISARYGRRKISRLGFISGLRLLKRKIF